jgi:haloalkane dehalogenase
MKAVLAQLKLSELVYVGQDWGGPVGLGTLARSPGLMKGAVILNTGINAPTETRSLSRAHDIAKTPVLGELVFEVFVPLFDRLHQAQGDPNSIPPDVAQLYGRPVLESGNAKAPLAMMRMVPYRPDEPSSAQLRDIERYVRDLNIPVEIVWGMNDPILGRGLPLMKKNFPRAPVTETKAGHFLQEEVPADIAAAVLRVVDRAQTANR